MSVRVLVGDCREAMRTLPEESVDCVVTSPPYYGLRDYGVEGQLGREPTLAGYVAALVDVFREVRRVLRPEGVAFLNLGDCYAGSGRGLMGNGESWAGTAAGAHSKQATNRGSARNTGGSVESGLAAKQLMMVPNRVAIALQDDRWWVRSEIVWAKSSCMPESVKDRPSCAHEKIWMLAKGARHYYHDGAASAPVEESTMVSARAAAKRIEEGDDEQRDYKYNWATGW